LYVLVGLKAAGAPAALYRSLAAAPVLVVRKLLRTRRLARFSADTWVRTERVGEHTNAQPPGDDAR
jgi:hypothetical protein